MSTYPCWIHRVAAGWLCLLCLALAGCGSTGSHMNGSSPALNSTRDSAAASPSPTASTTMPSSPSSLSSPAASASSSGTAQAGASDMAGGGNQSTPQVAYGTVHAIDPMTRQDVGVGMAGSAAVGGSLGAPGDKVYRVTLRLDDGTSQMVVLDAMPAYQVGDRIRYSNGVVQRN